MRCYRRLLNISNKDHVKNQEVRNRIQNAIGVHDDLLTMEKKRKLRWYGHTWRRQYCRGQWKEQEGEEDRRRDGKMTSMDRLEFGDSPRAAEDREGWKGIVTTSSVCGAPMTSEVKGMTWDEMRYRINCIVFYQNILLIIVSMYWWLSCDVDKPNHWTYPKYQPIPFLGQANSAEPDQTPQNAASDQGPQLFLTKISIRNRIKMKKYTRHP